MRRGRNVGVVGNGGESAGEACLLTRGFSLSHALLLLTPVLIDSCDNPRSICAPSLFSDEGGSLFGHLDQHVAYPSFYSLIDTSIAGDEQGKWVRKTLATARCVQLLSS